MKKPVILVTLGVLALVCMINMFTVETALAGGTGSARSSKSSSSKPCGGKCGWLKLGSSYKVTVTSVKAGWGCPPSKVTPSALASAVKSSIKKHSVISIKCSGSNCACASQKSINSTKSGSTTSAVSASSWPCNVKFVVHLWWKTGTTGSIGVCKS